MSSIIEIRHVEEQLARRREEGDRDVLSASVSHSAAIALQRMGVSEVDIHNLDSLTLQQSLGQSLRDKAIDHLANGTGRVAEGFRGNFDDSVSTVLRQGRERYLEVMRGTVFANDILLSLLMVKTSVFQTEKL